LWEVKDKTIKNLTKQDISIVDYKRTLVKQSQHTLSIFPSSSLIALFLQVKLRLRKQNYSASPRRKERHDIVHVLVGIDVSFSLAYCHHPEL
jgi:hypothetical protein